MQQKIGMKERKLCPNLHMHCQVVFRISISSPVEQTGVNNVICQGKEAHSDCSVVTSTVSTPAFPGPVVSLGQVMSPCCVAASHYHRSTPPQSVTITTTIITRSLLTPVVLVVDQGWEGDAVAWWRPSNVGVVVVVLGSHGRTGGQSQSCPQSSPISHINTAGTTDTQPVCEESCFGKYKQFTFIQRKL